MSERLIPEGVTPENSELLSRLERIYIDSHITDKAQIRAAIEAAGAPDRDIEWLVESCPTLADAKTYKRPPAWATRQVVRTRQNDIDMEFVVVEWRAATGKAKDAAWDRVVATALRIQMERDNP